MLLPRPGNDGLSHVLGISSPPHPLSYTLSSQTKNVKDPCEMLQDEVDFVFRQ